MNSFRILDRQVRRIVAAVVLLTATVMPALVPTLVGAETITERSVALTSSVKSATAKYTVNFTSGVSTGAFAVDFCTTAAIGSACSAPAGIDTTNAASTGNTVTSTNSHTGIQVVLGSAVAGNSPTSIELTNIVNPSATGVFYARIVTYADSSAMSSNYVDQETLGTYQDSGAVGLSITDGFAVSGAVLESMTFCASKNAIAQVDCSDAVAPSVSLGTNGILSNTLSEATIYTQLSTNAAGGAVVNLKSDALGCGGLVRDGAATKAEGCGITPVTGTAAAINDNDAKFGVKLGSPSATTGTIQAHGNYSTSAYLMNYAAGDGTGVTSPYGDTLYDTDSKPVNVGKMNLTFGADTSNITPAGNYKASFSLIATGKF